MTQAHDSASKQEEVAVWEDERRESKCAIHKNESPDLDSAQNPRPQPWE